VKVRKARAEDKVEEGRSSGSTDWAKVARTPRRCTLEIVCLMLVDLGEAEEFRRFKNDGEGEGAFVLKRYGGGRSGSVA